MQNLFTFTAAKCALEHLEMTVCISAIITTYDAELPRAGSHWRSWKAAEGAAWPAIMPQHTRICPVSWRRTPCETAKHGSASC